jgi:molybdopterin-containing oxidoreductase family iron-sulfur binding subunit
MEKCSFCVQRTQAGKLQAKMENRPLGGDDVITACAQACPTNAITFSNVNDKTSTVSKIREQNPRRLFYVLEQIHTLPNVSYLAKIRNTQEVIQGEKEGAEHAQQQTHEPVPSEQAPASTEAGH